MMKTGMTMTPITDNDSLETSYHHLEPMEPGKPVMVGDVRRIGLTGNVFCWTLR